MYAEDYDDVLLWNPLPGGQPGTYWDNISVVTTTGATVRPYRGQGCLDQPSTSFIVLLQPYLHSTAVFHCPSYAGYPLDYSVGYAASLDPTT